MRIDDRVEPMVRGALAAAVKADAPRFAHALRAFPDDEAAAHGARIAMAVVLYVLEDEYGGRPEPSELRAVATQLAEMEDWADVHADEVVAAVNAAFDGRPGDEVLPPERLYALPFVIAAYTLTAGCPDDEQWWEYLDRAEAAIDAG